MARAILTAMLTGIGSVDVSLNDVSVARYRVTADDGPGPVPAAVAVLAVNGWQVTDSWEQVSGGITGGEWRAEVLPAALLSTRIKGTEATGG